MSVSKNLPVFFCMDRAGIVGADGPTHQGMYDIAYLRCLPNMVLMAPKDEAELQRMIVTGINYTDGPIALRYPRGNGYGVALMEEGWEPLEIGKGELLRAGEDVLLVAYGSMVYPAMQVAEILKEHGLSAAVINARFAKPLDTALIFPLAKQNWPRGYPRGGLPDGGLWLSGSRGSSGGRYSRASAPFGGTRCPSRTRYARGIKSGLGSNAATNG